MAFGDGKTWAEPRLALKVGVEGTLDPATHRPVQRGGGVAGSGGRRGSAVDPNDVGGRLHGGEPELARDSISLKGEIAQWLARVRPWFAPDPWQASGLSELSAEGMAASDAVDCDEREADGDEPACGG